MTDTATSLIAQYRRAQLGIRADLLRAVVAEWPLLDPTRLDVTAAPWLRLTQSLIAMYRGRSAEQALQFYDALRVVRTGDLVPAPRPALTWMDYDAAATTSLRVLGPVAIKYRTGHGETVEQASRTAMTQVADAAGRHAFTGARVAIEAATVTDRHRPRFARYASRTACSFCRLTASRGAVYASRDTALTTSGRGAHRATQRYHDGCACLAVPIFDGDPLPPGSEDAARLWERASTGRYGADARAEFRRLLAAT